MTHSRLASFKQNWGIWLLAFGYFACYVPYSALTKALSRGIYPGMERPLAGFELLPYSLMASMVGMLVFITLKGWWQHAHHSRFLNLEVPHPTRWTFLSGLCTAGIIATTTMAYTFEGVSIVFVMLLMRGGVLIIAPIVDAVSRRKVRWFSWSGLVLSLAALLVAFAEGAGYAITLVCAVDISIYLASYFVRLRFMSRFAKSSEENANLRYFVEEQMVATPAALLLVTLVALFGHGNIPHLLAQGFLEVPSSPVFLLVLTIGFLSQGTGIFGGLILLDKRENTYCVPVNRSSSILAGVMASYSLTLLLGARPPRTGELVGAGLIICAILFLTIPPMMEKRRSRARSHAA